jgi:lipoprotein-releasing system ATP-binding protein
MNNMTIVLECQGLKKTYSEGTSQLTVLQNVNLTIHQGERIAIIGVSGSGKSTLLNMLGGLDIPTNGTVHIAGHNMASLNDAQRGTVRNKHLGFVYQFHHLLAEFTALENVCMPLLIGGGAINDAREAATALLEKVGLQHRLAHKPAELSGGERQRVAIARALVTNPSCVLLDEPTGNLDKHTAEKIHELMLELNSTLNISFVTVTHDTHLAERMEKVYVLEEGALLLKA